MAKPGDIITYRRSWESHSMRVGMVVETPWWERVDHESWVWAMWCNLHKESLKIVGWEGPYHIDSRAVLPVPEEYHEIVRLSYVTHIVREAAK